MKGFCAAALVIGLVVLTCICYLELRPEPGKHYRLADITIPSGDRFVVAEEHYDLVEGWSVGFYFIERGKTAYYCLLKFQTSKWRDAALAYKNDTISVWHKGALVATYDCHSRVFRNLIDSFSITNVVGVDGVNPSALPENYFVK